MPGGNGHDHGSEQSGLHMKENDKFFSRLLSKETSVANSSCRVPYYGRESGAVPFMWESRPGTPKHTFSEASLPPLTPPPSYYIYSTSKHSTKKLNSKPNTFCTILLKLTSRKALVSPSSSSSSSSSSLSSVSSSSLSSLSSAYSSVPPPSMKRPRQYLGRYSSSYSRSTTSSTSCPISKKKNTSCSDARHNTSNWFRYCCYSMKNAFLSIVGHGSSGQGTAQGLYV